MDLLTDGKIASNVSIFPSMVFLYNPVYNADLALADTFRVAQIDTLKMADISSPAGARMAFGTAHEEPESILAAYRAFVAKRDARFTEFYKTFRIDDQQIGLSLLDSYKTFFVNDEKKRSILQNALTHSLQKLLLLDKGLCEAACPHSTAEQEMALITAITDRIDELTRMRIDYGASARDLVRRYVAFGTLQTEKKDAVYFQAGKSPFVSLVGAVFGKSMVTDERYRLLSEMYSSALFAGASREELTKNMQGFIRYLVDGQSIGSQDFLPFVFFLKEYLVNQ